MTEQKSPIKVALVEDDQEIQTMYRTKLEQEGFEVQTASDGNIAVDMVKSFQPDLILLDMMMPGVTGIDFLGTLRRSKDNDHIKVIIMTNIDDQRLHKSMERMGITDYLVKAEVTPSQVVDKIHIVLAR